MNAPALAREHLRTWAGHVPEAALDDALIATSELVTNAVTHGRPTVELRVNFDPPHLKVAVYDDGPAALPAEPLRPSPRSDHGRGLGIVDAITTSWGVTPDRRGKTVWFRIDSA